MNDAVVKLWCRSLCQNVLSRLGFALRIGDRIESRRSYSYRNAYNGQGDQRDAHLSLLAAIALSPRTAGSLYSSKACVNYFTPGLPNRRNEPCRHRASRGACIVLSARHKEAAAMVTAATPATDSRGTGSRGR